MDWLLRYNLNIICTNSSFFFFLFFWILFYRCFLFYFFLDSIESLIIHWHIQPMREFLPFPMVELAFQDNWFFKLAFLVIFKLGPRRHNIQRCPFVLIQMIFYPIFVAFRDVFLNVGLDEPRHLIFVKLGQILVNLRLPSPRIAIPALSLNLLD